MTDEIAIVGDIHGSLSKLRAIVPLALNKSEHVAFVGDYINRGPNSAGVIDYLVRLAADNEEVIFLEGHHDISMRRCLEEGALAEFLQLGGAATIRSYIGDSPSADVASEFHNAVPESHLSFLRGLRSSHETDAVLVRHQHRETGSQHHGKFVISGHTPQKNRTPYVGSRNALIDTGCGTWPDGRLTCLLWPSLRWFQEPAE